MKCKKLIYMKSQPLSAVVEIKLIILCQFNCCTLNSIYLIFIHQIPLNLRHIFLSVSVFLTAPQLSIITTDSKLPPDRIQCQIGSLFCLLLLIQLRRRRKLLILSHFDLSSFLFLLLSLSLLYQIKFNLLLISSIGRNPHMA